MITTIYQCCLRAAFWAFLGLSLMANLSFHTPELAERIQYEVRYSNSNIGTLTADKYLEDGETKYVIKTDVKKRLIKMFHVVFHLDARFSQGSLTKAEVKSIVNDNVWDYSNLKWQKDCYQVSKEDEEPYKLCKEQAAYSTACLYFKEPKEYSRIFSESYTQYVPIKGNRTDGYTLKLPSGNDNYYHYDEEGLKKAVINDAVIQLTFIRE